MILNDYVGGEGASSLKTILDALIVNSLWIWSQCDPNFGIAHGFTSVDAPVLTEGPLVVNETQPNSN